MPFLKLATELGTVVAALLIVLDPLGALPIVVGLRAHVDARHARRLIFRVITGATILLLLFTITGTWMLALFGITLDDMRIGGGLLLLILSLKLVMEGRFGEAKGEGYKAAVVPIISPLLIGPGAITAAVVLAAIHGVWMTAIAAVVAMLISLVIFLSSNFVHRLVGDTGTDLISRVMGVLIATIAVGYIREGILGLLEAVHIL